MLLVALSASAMVLCKDGEAVLSADLCYFHGGVVEPGVLETARQTGRLAAAAEREATASERSAKAQEALVLEARLTREAISRLGDQITDEMRATREWALASQQATLEVQAGLVRPGDFVDRAKEVYLEHYQPVIWAAVLRLRAALMEAARRRAYIVALVGESNVDMYESFARRGGACILEVEDGAWIATGGRTTVLKLHRAGGRSISSDAGDFEAYDTLRATAPKRERCNEE